MERGPQQGVPPTAEDREATAKAMAEVEEMRKKNLENELERLKKLQDEPRVNGQRLNRNLGAKLPSFLLAKF